MFDKFSTGNFYIGEQGTGNTPKDWEGLGRIGEHIETIKSSPLPLQGEG
jgi:hypothetical protein